MVGLESKCTCTNCTVAWYKVSNKVELAALHANIHTIVYSPTVKLI